MPASVLLMPEAVKAVQLYEQGYGMPEIADTLGRSRKAIRTGLRHMGVPTRTNAEARRAWLALRNDTPRQWPFPARPPEPTPEPTQEPKK